MASYTVKLRILGWAEIDVEADGEREALAEAKDRVTVDDFNDWETSWNDRDHDVTCLDEEDDEEFDEDDSNYVGD